MALIDIILEEEQREGTKAVVNQWLFHVGEFVEVNQPIVEIETDKVMMEVIAPTSGVLTEIILDKGADINDSSAIGRIDDTQKPSIKTTPQKNEETDFVENEPVIQYNPNSSTLISPAVRRLISQHNINTNTITGTGKNNRVTTRDVERHLKNPATNNSQSSQHLPISNMRASIAKHMVDSLLHTAPHVTSVFNLDMSAMIKHRKAHKEDFEKQGANLTFTAYFIAATVAGIKQVPLINSQLHKDTIEVFNNINIGIGTALNDEGLIVPVLKNCENHNLLAIASSLTKMTNKARMKKLKPSDVKGGTFTISNHGVSGSLIATPIIINQPQSAILGIGKMEKRVIVKEVAGDEIMTIKPMCYVTLTIDHRVLDAHQCNQFLSVFVETLENWE